MSACTTWTCSTPSVGGLERSSTAEKDVRNEEGKVVDGDAGCHRRRCRQRGGHATSSGAFQWEREPARRGDGDAGDRWPGRCRRAAGPRWGDRQRWIFFQFQKLSTILQLRPAGMVDQPAEGDRQLPRLRLADGVVPQEPACPTRSTRPPTRSSTVPSASCGMRGSFLPVCGSRWFQSPTSRGGLCNPILVGLYCGLRPAEYRALRWRDLDLERGELRVVQSVQRVRRDQVSEHLGRRVEGFRFGPTKTHRSRRPVAMPPVLVELLRDWRLRQAAERERAGAAWTDLDLVFTDARGYPHCLERVRRHFYRALERAGVRRVVLYALRHTMATLVLHETKDLKLVAARLGHADETLALRTYGHLLPGVDREVARRLGEVIRLRGDGGRDANADRRHTNGTSRS